MPQSLTRLACIVLVCTLSACDIFNREEMAPGFIHISRADLVTNEAVEGAPTHDIVDVHVFANEDFVGSYELPATIAILENGPTRISINAGIKNSGALLRRVIYPFYAPLNIEKDLLPGVVLPVREDSTAVFNYFPNAYNFVFEDFESIGNAFVSGENSDAEVQAQNAVVRSGELSGQISLSSGTPYFFSTLDWELANIPRGIIAYLEIDFKGNNPLEIGIQRGGPTGPKFFLIGLNPREEWTKVYIDLSRTLGQNVGTLPFTFYFESQLLPENSSAEMYVDNVKFVYPK